jgi:RNA polymerase sigma-70 factor (ECF subfamily)
MGVEDPSAFSAGPPGPVVDDEALAARVAGGDADAFRALYHRYVRRTYTWCAHVLGPGRAEDACQEVFLLLWQHAGRFDPARASFASWFTSITRNHLGHELRHLRVRRRRDAGFAISELLETAAAPDPDPAEAACRREDARALARALRALPEEQRRVLVLAYFAGLSQSQIARSLRLPAGTVKKRVSLAMRKLRAALGARPAEPAREAVR